jgi:hypothetical protein
MKTTYTEMLRDAAYARNIDPGWPAVAGYYGGPRALNMWTVADWDRFKGHRKLPVWVAGLNGSQEAVTAVRSLEFLGVPRGVWTVVDMETRADRTYVTAFGAGVQAAGYKVWVYGSASTVFGNPALDGYWVADYAGIGPFMYDKPGMEIRATQYASGTQFDSSTVKAYTYNQAPWWQ